MPLQDYCRDKRLVVLRPAATAFEAARALADNHVGAIVVQDRVEVVGIVTDRDLSVRVTGSGVDPMVTLVFDVMSPAPVTLSAEDSEEHAIEVMRQQHVRRLPIRDDTGRVAGMVTLDDLILAGKIDSQAAAAIVESQLAQPAKLKPEGSTHPAAREGDHPSPAERHAARAQQTLGRFAERLADDLGIRDREVVLAVFTTVASAVVRRLTPAEAADLAAQLPSEIRQLLLDLPAGPDENVTRESITREIVERLGVAPTHAWRLVEQVGAAMADVVSPGEIADVVSQLPADLKPIFDR